MIDNFYALTNGKVPVPYEEIDEASVRTLDLGLLSVPSGTLVVGDAAFPEVEIKIQKGDYKVIATIADVSEKQDGTHDRNAYLSLVFSDEDPVRLVNAIDESEEYDSYGIGIDSGTAGFGDSVELENEEIDFDEYDIEDGEFGIFKKNDDKAYLIYARSGWGDGGYPVIKTVDKDGNLTGIHIDFYVVGIDPDEEI